jgi:NAD(P)-dependent dehydrogenase (short-subunit alcohol dehydrogenase family)
VRGGQDRHLSLGIQNFGVESDRRIERQVQQSHIGLPILQQFLLLMRLAEQQIDGGCAGLRAVGIEQFGQQLAGSAGFDGEDEAGASLRSLLGTSLSCGYRAEDRAPLGQQHGSGLGERDLAAGALQQRDPKLSFEPGDGAGQGRLGYLQTLGGLAEVQFLGDGDEVPQLAYLHGCTVTSADCRLMSPRYCCLTETVLVPGSGAAMLAVMSEKTIALVTGANKGIGYEIAAGLGALGWSVGVGARDEQRRMDAVAKLRAAGADAFGVPLDVTDDESVTAAAQLIEERAGRLDVLVNNAGVAGGWPEEPTAIDLETVRRLVETNVIGVIRVTNAMLPLLRHSAHPRIVNQSSHVGSLALQTTPGVDLGGISGAYAPTKTFLNAVTIQYGKELSGTNILINNACPGYVATDLNGFSGTQTPEQGAVIAIRLAALPDDGPTGQLFDDNGVVPW